MVLFYCATAVFIGGFLYKIYGYATTPAPLKIPTTPAPTTSAGVVMRLFREVFFFESLFKSNKWTWVGGMLFHVTFAIVIIRHLRYFLNPTPAIISLIGPIGVWAGVLLLGGTAYLFVRRIAVDRVRYISSGADYFALILIGLIALTGLGMKFVARTDVAAVKAYMVGIVTFHPVDMPADPSFIVHLTLVMALMVYFPFSKLIHSGGIFFSPTRYQIDNPREVRHVNPWAAPRS
jgi:nitrate reductase gamma subunit